MQFLETYFDKLCTKKYIIVLIMEQMQSSGLIMEKMQVGLQKTLQVVQPTPLSLCHNYQTKIIK